MKNLRDSYKLYKESVQNPVDSKTYLELAAEYNKFLMSKVFEGKEVTLPSRMGTLAVIGKEQNIRFHEGEIVGLAPDWVKTKALWESDPVAKENKKRVFHTNDHTNNIRYKFFWSKKNVLVLNKTLYSLRLTRTNKRDLNGFINDNKDFKVI